MAPPGPIGVQTVMRKSYMILILGLFLTSMHVKTSAQLTLEETPIDTLTVASKLDTPWEILWGPDDHIWITERYGRISRLDPNSGAITEVTARHAANVTLQSLGPIQCP